ncbi:hypothetical protein [Undibacterium terreum]|uniref:Uncharacterized protein n=1 Tax=Undibacterium terreum TaxID=1224302 RepID=A0A916U9F4_9BURK|nr:hypothetical protein [Undibacterium terreum]GGC65193.1 hypothetical protein GCM10011396_10240 [Undibacterium terreum]
MLRIEFEEPHESVCKCCQNTITRLTRFVYQDDDAFAVYFAQFTRGHDDKHLRGIISLGEWGNDEVGPEARVAFPVRIWLNGDNFQVGMVDAADSPWSHETFLGRILDRKEALAHEWINDVFHITDHMVMDDKEIVAFFA